MVAPNDPGQRAVRSGGSDLVPVGESDEDMIASEFAYESESVGDRSDSVSSFGSVVLVDLYQGVVAKRNCQRAVAVQDLDAQIVERDPAGPYASAVYLAAMLAAGERLDEIREEHGADSPEHRAEAMDPVPDAASSRRKESGTGHSGAVSAASTT